MAAPPRRVLALSEAFGLGSVQYLFDPAPYPRGGFGFVVQIGFRIASTSSVVTVSTGLLLNGAAYVASVDFH